MRNLKWIGPALLGLLVSSTAWALTLEYEENFNALPTPTFGPITSGPLTFSAGTVVTGATDPDLQWCNALDIDVAQNATMVSFELYNSSHTDPIHVAVFDATGSPGTVLPGHVFNHGIHTVQVIAGPHATIELRGGNCETWIDDVQTWSSP
ncbi:MAG: hypothetical protein AAGA48_25090 [Myxococcota bacterium]